MQSTQSQVIASLARQVSQQQLYVEEMTRSAGDSGLKLTRLTRSGSKSYFSTSYAGMCVIATFIYNSFNKLICVFYCLLIFQVCKLFYLHCWMLPKSSVDFNNARFPIETRCVAVTSDVSCYIATKIASSKIMLIYYCIAIRVDSH